MLEGSADRLLYEISRRARDLPLRNAQNAVKYGSTRLRQRVAGEREGHVYLHRWKERVDFELHGALRLSACMCVPIIAAARRLKLSVREEKRCCVPVGKRADLFERDKHWGARGNGGTSRMRPVSV